VADKQPSRETVLPKGDSRLNEFLRRAAPIITAERGLNPSSRLKLQALATDLNLPPSLFELALDYFVESGATATDRLTRYEKAFCEQFEAELEKSNQKILSKQIEAAAMAIATTKYQIQEPRARQLIHNVARQCGWQRVTLKEAEQFVGTLVVEQIGSATSLNEAIRQRLLRAAEAWGVSAQIVDQFVHQTLLENNRRQFHKSPVPGIVLGCLLVLVAAGLLTIGNYLAGNASPPDPTASAENSGPVREPEIRTHPSWNNFESEQMLQFRERIPQLAERWDGFITDDPQPRFEFLCQHFDESVEGLAGNPPEPNTAAVDFQVLALLAEPISNYQLKLLDHWTAACDVPALLHEIHHPRQIQLSLLALKFNYRLANELRQRLDSGERHSKPNAIARFARILEERIRSLTGVPSTLAYRQFSVDARAALLRRWWASVGNTAFEQPNLSIRFIDPLVTHSRDLIDADSIEAMQQAILVTLIENHPRDFPQLRTFAQSVLATAKDPFIQDLARVLAQQPASPRNEWLATQLMPRLDAEDWSKSDAKPLALLQEQFGTTTSQSATETLTDKFQSWLAEDPVLQSILDNSAAGQQPQQIADVAARATMAFALCLSQWDPFEQLRENSPTLPMLADNFYQSLGLTRFGTISGPPRQVNRLRLQELLQVIGESGADPTGRREAFSNLPSVADRIPDLTQNEAQLVMEYCLTIDDDDGLIEMRTVLPRLAHWRSIWLILADEMENERRSLDRLRLLASLIANIDIPGDGEITDRQRLRLALLDRILQSQAYSVAKSSTPSAALWDRLPDALLNEYEHRRELLNDETSAVTLAESIAALQRRLGRQLKTINPPAKGLANTPDFISVWRTTHQLRDNLRTLTQFLARKFPTVKRELQNQLEVFEQKFRTTPELAKRLWLCESTFLKQCLLVCQSPIATR